MRSDNWTPAWVAENRLPSFIDFGNGSFSQEFEQKKREEFSSGVSLYASRDFTTIMIERTD